MNEYSLKNNINYDLVLISRMDVCWLTPLYFNKLETSKFYSPIWGEDEYYYKKGCGELSYWYISNKNNITKLSKLFDNLNYYVTNYGNSAHVIDIKHIETFLSANEIEHKLKSYLHHREFEINPMTINEIENIIKNKRAIYDLTVDKTVNKIGNGKKLEKYPLKELPKYLQNNFEKFKNWID